MPGELVLAGAGRGSAEQELTALVLDGVTSEDSKRAYAKGLGQFFAWVRDKELRPFSKALVQEYRAWLLARSLAPATVNLHLSPRASSPRK